MKSAALSLLVLSLTACMSGPPERSQVSLQEARSYGPLFDPVSGLSYQLAVQCPLCGRQVSAPQLAATAPPSAVASIDPAATVVALLEASVPAAAVASAELELPPKLADPISKVAVSPSEEGRSTPVALKLDVELASIARMVPFALGKSTLGPMGRRAVAELVPIANMSHAVVVRGRVDSTGSDELNARLAKARADTVASAFADAGIGQEKISTSYCLNCFIAGNESAAGRQLNRRVDVDLRLPKAQLALVPPAVYAGDLPPLILARTLEIPSRR